MIWGYFLATKDWFLFRRWRHIDKPDRQVIEELEKLVNWMKANFSDSPYPEERMTDEELRVELLAMGIDTAQAHEKLQRMIQP